MPPILSILLLGGMIPTPWHTVTTMADTQIEAGIIKHEIVVTPPADSVNIFRISRSFDGREKEVREVISYTHGTPKTETVTLFQPHDFPFTTDDLNKRGIVVSYGAGSAILGDHSIVHTETDGDTLLLKFTDISSRIVTSYSFSNQTESLQKALAEHPELKKVAAAGNPFDWESTIITKKEN